MNDLLDSWSSPWRAFHKNLAAAAPFSDGKPDPSVGASSWLGRARGPAETTRARPDQAKDH
jgi:hypothetical protein